MSTETFQAFGARFWTVLSSGQLETLPTFYAESVLVKDGSEMLKRKWGVVDETIPRDGSDMTLVREDVRRGYEAMIAKFTIERWAGKLSEERPFCREVADALLIKVDLGKGMLKYWARPLGDTFEIYAEHSDL